MYTLFLDTHNQEVVVVLYKDGEVKQAVNKVSGYQHSQMALPLIKDVMDKEGIFPKALDQIIVVIGPGSFTGVRIAVTIAKTMAYSLNIPIKTIDSLRLKAISIDSKEDFYVSVLEKNGAYVGKFSSEYVPVGEYSYYSKKEYDSFLEENEVKDVDKIDYNRLYEMVKTFESINPHAVKPLYIKHIEVTK